MTTQTSAPDPLAERMSRLEGAYEHLATKADLAGLEARFEADLARLEVRIAQMEIRLTKWIVGAIIGSTVFASSLVALVSRLID